MLIQDNGERKVVVDFTGGHLSSDGGALLLRQIDNGLGISRGLAACFRDRRDQHFVEHALVELIAQRVQGLALGYEDLNDHNELRRDPLLALCAGKSDVLGEKRAQEDRGNAMAGASTLNRLELGNNRNGRYHKISHDPEEIAGRLLELGVRSLPRDTKEVVLDFDATDDPLHGRQEGRFFHGYYSNYCYLPLYCFAGDVILWAQLRTSDRDASDGTLEALKAIVAAIRGRFAKVRIIVRGDSGFCREAIMAWCEGNRVYYCLGLARNARLEGMLAPALAAARQKHCLCGGASSREFTEFEYQTLDSWSRARRVIGKAEVSGQGDNPRFVVANLPAEGFEEEEREGGRFEAQTLYEEIYCGRGEMENMVKQMQLDLKADRTSTHHMASNQLRLWLSAFGYLLLERLRALGLAGGELARASVGTIRLRLLKIGAQITVSVRRVRVQMATSYPMKQLFALCHQRLMAMAASTA